MTELDEIIRQGSSSLWILIPSAILLGGLHGLEPGHSKTMMAAFIVAVRGTVAQALLLALAATISHTAIVWIVALLGMHYGMNMGEENEPYFQLASGLLIIGVALWILWRTWREQQSMKAEADHHHGDHAHDETRRIDTGHGIAILSIFEENAPPRFRVHFEHNGKAVKPPADEVVTVLTARPGNTTQLFTFADKGAYLESLDHIPEPHEFSARLRMAHGDHAHDFDVEYKEHSHGQKHDHGHEGLDVASGEYQDAHQRAHANDIKRRFANRPVTTGQIILFGLSGGLIPCGAAITVLVLCLQLKKFWLGMTLVLCFSIGLALTMMLSGVIAALSVKHIGKNFKGFSGKLLSRIPYVSGSLIVILGLYVAYHGFASLPR